MDHTLLAGLELQRNETSQRLFRGLTPPFDLYAPVYGNYTAPTVFTPQPGVVQHNAGVYAQNQMKWGRWIGLLGLRHDQARTDTEGRPAAAVDDSATSKRVGVVYLADGGVAPYLSYAESFLPLGGVDVAGAPFKPPRVKHVEVRPQRDPPWCRTTFPSDM